MQFGTHAFRFYSCANQTFTYTKHIKASKILRLRHSGIWDIAMTWVSKLSMPVGNMQNKTAEQTTHNTVNPRCGPTMEPGRRGGAAICFSLSCLTWSWSNNSNSCSSKYKSCCTPGTHPQHIIMHSMWLDWVLEQFTVWRPSSHRLAPMFSQGFQ